MKTLVASLMILTVLSSCDVYVTEPRYDPRDRMIGYYDVEEYSNTYHDYTYYTLRVSKNAHSNREIYLGNFYGADITVFAYVDGDRVTIPLQSVNGYEVEGTGIWEGNGIDFHYRVKDLYEHTQSDFCDTYAAIE
jgi:hypothetical protein